MSFKIKPENNILNYSSTEEIDYKTVTNILERDHFVCLRGLIDPVLIDESVQLLKSQFDAKKDRKNYPSNDGYFPNFQRLAIGELGSYAKFMRVFFNPLWADDIYKMHDHFKTMIKIRNKLYKIDENFAIDNITNGLFTGARIQQYPRGGGFIVAHKDTNASKAVDSFCKNSYYQVLLIMSEKGKDYFNGGGFIERKENRIYYEDVFNKGDIAIYNAYTTHGVCDIDPQEDLSLTSLNGRLSAFVTLYESKPDLSGES